MRLPLTFTPALAVLGCLGCGQGTTSSTTDESKQNLTEQKEKATPTLLGSKRSRTH
jgi:hypothetical protein